MHLMKQQAKRMIGIGLGLGIGLALFAGMSVRNATANVDKLTMITEKMLNAIDYYDSVEVTFEAQGFTGAAPVTVSEEITMRLRPDPAGRADTTSYVGTDKKSHVSIRNGDQRYELNVEEGVYSLIRTQNVSETRLDTAWRRLMLRLKKGQAPTMMQRQAPVQIEGVGEDALFPQEEVFAHINGSDSTRIVGEEQVLGRNAVILEIIPAEPRETADRILFWVDESTGILLKQEHYKREKLVSSLTATKLVINPEIDPAKFQIDIPEGARLQNPNI